MRKESEQVFDALKKDLSAYVQLKLELLKLNTYERIGRTVSILSYGLILIFIAFFAFLFIFLALGFFLGEQLGSVSVGFAVVAAIYLLLLSIIGLYRKRIREKILNIIIASLLANDVNNNEPTEQTINTSSDPEL